MNVPALSRRGFLKSAGAAVAVFTLGAYVPIGGRAMAQGLPEGNRDPNMFIKITSDNRVVVVCKHFDMGQGTTTGLPTLVADELDADWSLVDVEFAPNNPEVYKNLAFGAMATGGTTSMYNSFAQMRHIGAAARAMIVQAAAIRWGVAPDSVTVANSVVTGGSNSATFAELAEAAMALPVPTDVTLKTPEQWTLIGKTVPRLDNPGKTTGKTSYPLDIRREGAMKAVILRAPKFGAVPVSVDDAAARALDGVDDVVMLPIGVVVLAKDTWTAFQARDLLSVEWDESNAETRGSDQILADFQAQLDEPGLPAAKKGDATAGLQGATAVIEADYSFPYLAHTPMEPLNCTIEFDGTKAEIWSGSQIQSIDTYVASNVLGIEPQNVVIHTLFAGGSFGRRGEPTGRLMVEACSIAKAINGRYPVHLVWSREDDVKGGYYRPLTVHRVKAGVDADGNVAGWDQHLVCQSIFTGTPFEGALVHDGVDHGSVEGAADTPYGFSNFSVESTNAQAGVPVLWWRSVGHSHTAMVMETMIDELAVAAGRDAVDLRLELLAGNERDSGVVRLAAEKGGWGETLGEGRGRGFAYHQSFHTPVAMVVDVTVDGDDFTVDRVVASVDCGVAVNPDNIVAQIEGCVGFGLSSILRDRIELDGGEVVNENFWDYQVTRMSDMPEIEVHIVPSQNPPTGVGEPGLPPLAPAIANAIFAATGKRLRDLPLSLS